MVKIMETNTTHFDSNLESYKESVKQLLNTHSEPIRIFFNKIDGTIREMLATTNPSLIPASTYEKKTDRVKELNPSIQVVFDTEKQEWRSFRWDSLVEVRKP